MKNLSKPKDITRNHTTMEMNEIQNLKKIKILCFKIDTALVSLIKQERYKEKIYKIINYQGYITSETEKKEKRLLHKLLGKEM